MLTAIRKWSYRNEVRIEVHALLLSFVRAGEKFENFNFNPIYDSAFAQKMKHGDAACLCVAAYLEETIENLPKHIREMVLADLSRVGFAHIYDLTTSIVNGPVKENVFDLIPATIMIGFTLSMTLLFSEQGKISAEYKDLIFSEILGLLHGKPKVQRRTERFDDLFKKIFK